jgi:hypothetical protein
MEAPSRYRATDKQLAEDNAQCAFNKPEMNWCVRAVKAAGRVYFYRAKIPRYSFCL